MGCRRKEVGEVTEGDIAGEEEGLVRAPNRSLEAAQGVERDKPCCGENARGTKKGAGCGTLKGVTTVIE